MLYCILIASVSAGPTKAVSSVQTVARPRQGLLVRPTSRTPAEPHVALWRPIVRASLPPAHNLRASLRARHNLEANTFGASLVLPFVLAFVLTIVLTFVLTLRASLFVRANLNPAV